MTFTISLMFDGLTSIICFKNMPKKIRFNKCSRYEVISKQLISEYLTMKMMLNDSDDLVEYHQAIFFCQYVARSEG